MVLISESRWIKKIIELEKSSSKSTKPQLKKAILHSIQKNIPGKRFGILFSGGVDSSLIAYICKKAKGDFICYCVGLKDSPDVLWAKEIAKKYGFRLKTRVFKPGEMEDLFKRTKKMLRHSDTLSIGVGSVLVAGIEIAKKDKVSDIFTGLGSEEIFAGYHFHSEAKDVHKECWNRLKSMWKRDLLRDYAIAGAMKVTLLNPFLDENLIKIAMGIPAKRKIDKNNKKIILREIAEDFGLAKKFAWRSKKAAQYGSWFDKCISKLARQNGFVFKQDYINSI